MAKLFFLSLTLFGVCIYFIPTIVAIVRRHAQVLQIALLNAFLGWFFPIWVGALIWSTTKNTDEFVQTKGAWITIGVFFVLASFPLLMYSSIPQKHQVKIKDEMQYKKIIYTTEIDSDTGKIVRKVIEINREDD